MRIPLVTGLIAAALLVAGCAPPPKAAPQPKEGRQQLRAVKADCLNGFSAPVFDPLRGKLAPRAAESSAAMLAEHATPAAGERDALLLWTQVVMNCRQNVVAVAKQFFAPEVVTTIDLAAQRNIAKLLELYQGAISYGAYDRWHRRAVVADAQALRDVKQAVKLGTVQGDREAAAVVRGERQQLDAELRRYHAALQRRRRTLRAQGIAPSCSTMGAFEVCRY